MGNKLVQRRIQQAHGYRQSLHGFENAFKITPLDREQLVKSLTASGFIIGQNHFAHGLDPVAFKEHVLSTAESNTHSSEGTGNAGIMRGVGIGPDLHPGIFICQGHQFTKVTAHFRGDGLDLAIIYFAG